MKIEEIKIELDSAVFYSGEKLTGGLNINSYFSFKKLKTSYIF